MTTTNPFNLILKLCHSGDSARRWMACAVAGASLLGSALAQPRHTVTDLGMLPGCDTSVAVGIKDPAHIPVGLPLLPGDNMGSASRINNPGHVLGGSAFSFDGSFNTTEPQKLVLRRDGGVYDLQSVPDSATGAGWVISTASGMNNLGQIVGLGVHNGQNRAYLLTSVQ
jgi:hypothetical protein